MEGCFRSKENVWVFIIEKRVKKCIYLSKGKEIRSLER